MDSLGQSILDRQRIERRRTDVFLKGRVTAVDESSVPHKVTIGGRTMPYTGPALVVGDIVVFVNIDDAFSIGKFAGT